MPPRTKQTVRKTVRPMQAATMGSGADDISATYGAPFPIFSKTEGDRYNVLKRKTLLLPRYIEMELLEEIGLKDKFVRLCAKGGWERFVTMHYPVFKDLTLEFFTSLRFNPDKPSEFWFRLRGHAYNCNEKDLNRIFGFPKGKVEESHQNFCSDTYWHYLTELHEFNARNSSNANILSHEHLLLHKFLYHTFFFKTQSNKMSTRELFLLWCVDEKIKVRMPFYILQLLKQFISTKGSYLGLGYLATALAHDNDVDTSDLPLLPFEYFDSPYLRRSEILEHSNMVLRNPRTRDAIKRRSGEEASSSRPRQVEPEETSSEESGGEGWEKVCRLLEDSNRQT